MRLFTNTAPPTRLAGALTDSATTITVDSTAGWPTPTGADVALGCLTYPNADTLELFTYTGKTSTTFTGVVRGVDDTDPKAHLNRALVVHVASWTDLGGGGASTLDGLSDVDTAGATNGDALIYDGAAWGPGAASTVAALDDLTDVTTAGAASGDHLVYDGAGWEPGNPDPDLFSQFLYNSSGAQAGNRFNTWSDLYTALGNLDGAKTVFFEQDETIPAGAYDLDNVTFKGNGLQYDVGGITLTFGTGCTITSWVNAEISSIRLLSTSTGPVMTLTGSFTLGIRLLSHVHSTTSPFFLATAGGQHAFALSENGRFLKLAGGVENYDNTAGAFTTQLIINRGEGSEVGPDTLKSTNGVIYIDIVSDPANDLSFWPWPQTHTNLVVGVSVPLMFPRAGATAFVPAGSIAATTVQAAIEELDGDISALPALDSGTYTPTLTNVTNVSSSSAQVARWTQIGDQVTVYGRVSVDPIASATSTQVRVSLPVASNLGSNSDLAGVCVGDLSDESAGHIVADTANDEALIEAHPVSTSQHTYVYTYSYTVI